LEEVKEFVELRLRWLKAAESNDEIAADRRGCALPVLGAEHCQQRVSLVVRKQPPRIRLVASRQRMPTILEIAKPTAHHHRIDTKSLGELTG
jgi:hypothetical protein